MGKFRIHPQICGFCPTSCGADYWLQKIQRKFSCALYSEGAWEIFRRANVANGKQINQ
jgi:hypothetical protein